MNEIYNGIIKLKALTKETINQEIVLNLILNDIGIEILHIDESSMDNIGTIDLNLIPIIQQLNRIGLKTTYSCGGHIKGLDFLKWIYFCTQKPIENFENIYDIIQNFDINSIFLVGNMYISIIDDGNVPIGRLIPNYAWYEERDNGYITLRCCVAKTIDQRDDYINDLLNHLSKIEIF